MSSLITSLYKIMYLVKVLFFQDSSSEQATLQCRNVVSHKDSL